MIKNFVLIIHLITIIFSFIFIPILFFLRACFSYLINLAEWQVFKVIIQSVN
jgi:hypothetical protein